VTQRRSPRSAVASVEEPTVFVVDDDDLFRVGGDGRADIPTLEPGASLAVGSSLPPANRPFFIQLYSLEVGNSS